MRTIIVDDEAWVLKQLQSELTGMENVELVGVFRGAIESLAYIENHPVDFALLDVEMRGIDGIELGKRIKTLRPSTVVIYITSYTQYYREAFEDVKADYYILKPFDHKDVADAVERARLLSTRNSKRIRFHTFGRFDVFADGKLITFSHAKAKELLAVCVDRRGGDVTMEEAIDKLWPDESASPQVKLRYRKAVSYLHALFTAEGISGVFLSGYGKCHIDRQEVECDYFSFMEAPCNVHFEGEYMFQYSWAETRTAELDRLAQMS